MIENTNQTERKSMHARRKGSVLVLVVGVLAVLAAMALSYITVVRIDRRSTDAYQEQENLQQQVVAVTTFLQAMLTADQFGNQMTNASTPKTAFNPLTGQIEPNWPNAFMDGEYFDYPWTDAGQLPLGQNSPGFTWNTSLPGQPPSSNSLLPRTGANAGERAFADDAWLSPLEPIDTGNASNEGPEWDTWPQITNLNSAYRYRRSDPNQPQLRQWTRGTGRFVDPGMMLLQRPLNAPTPRHGFPGADLTLNKDRNALWTDPDPTTNPPNQPNGPALGVNQKIYDLQMADLQEEFYWPATGNPSTPPIQGLRELLPADERFWADTDGDGRPDARWQQIDALGNAFGKVWVLACRIIDNSAMANPNAHISFGYDPADPTNTAKFGDGKTPADVDLYRLFASQLAGSPTAHPDISWPPMLFDVTHLNDSFLENLINGLRVPNMLSQLDQINSQNDANGQSNLLGLTPSPTSPRLNFVAIGETWPATGTLFGDPMLPPPLSPLELKRIERAAIWRYFGNNPLSPVASTGAPYPYRDEIDLRTFSGYNLLRTVSRIEQRFDGPRPLGAGIPGFLPGVTPPYNSGNNGPALGPMRSKEWDIPSQSPRASGDTFVLLPNSGQYTNQLKLERHRKDIRHLLTTVSGSGSIGPVPVLNPIFDRQFSTRKVDLRRFVNPPVTLTLPFDPQNNINRIRQSLTDAYSAFVWALAPLATNQPLMSPLDRIGPFSTNPLVYAALANDADLHYGGGIAGPASKAAKDVYGLTPNSQGGADQIGAAYALLRAGAMTVNTIDALDNETALGNATSESPTMLRLFNQLDLQAFLNANDNIPLRDMMKREGAVPLGVRFPQGDLWSDSTLPPVVGNTIQNQFALPTKVVGAPKNGVTLVGLDRQPFLVRALTVAVYAEQGSYPAQEGLANSEINPLLPAEQLGSLFVVELGNPWPEPLDLKEYRVRIASGTDAAELLELDFVASTIPNGTLINAGSRTAFYYFLGPTGDAPTGAQADWDIIRDQLKAEIDGQGGANEVREITDLVPGAAGATGGVMFQNIDAGPVPVLLIRSINPISNSAQPTQNTDVLVDRLSPDPASADSFPAVLTETIDLQTFATDPPMAGLGMIPSFTGRIAVQSVLRRNTLPGTSGGFPSYVVERPKNNIQNFQSVDETVQVWEASPDLEPIKPIDDLGQTVIDNTGGTSGVSEIGLIAQEDGSLDLPAFELFVPNGQLLATSELGQLCAFAHMYIHTDQSAPNVLDAWKVTAPLLEPGKWATVSEQLGWDAHYLYNNNPTPPPGLGPNLNPYLGVLDPSRFILNSGAASPGDLATVPQNALPDPLAVPLAVRVFDAFEAIPTPSGGFVQGRININTAPKRILELLPFVDPRDPINQTFIPSIAGWTSPQAINNTRVDWLERYRRRDADTPGGPDNVGGVPIENAPFNYTQLNGLRMPGINAPWSLGLVSKGELATMGQWSGNSDGLLAGQLISSNDLAINPVFLELGANNADNINVPLDIRPAALGTEAGDDPEERLAIFRAISNIVSTRSDIFTAWFILRAYDPKDIEAITIPPDIEGDDDAIVSLMNPGNPNGLPGVSRDNPGLIPSFERRMLVIFDRSNVTRPTDRPRILLQVELPIR